MAERYSRLFTAKNDLYVQGSPVVLSAGALLKDHKTGQVLAQLKIKNIDPRVIKRAKVTVRSFDMDGKAIKGEACREYLDLNVSRDGEFGQKKLIPLDDPAARAFWATVAEVVFEDGSVWTNRTPYKSRLPEPIPLSERLQDDELVNQYELRYGQSKIQPARAADLWYCACGALNRAEEESCHRCGCRIDELLACDLNELRGERDRRLAGEEDGQTAERDDSWKSRLLIGLLLSACICVTGVVLAVKLFVTPGGGRAWTGLNTGRIEEVISSFKALTDRGTAGAQSRPAEEPERADGGARVRQLMTAGDYAAAAEAAGELGDKESGDAFLQEIYDEALAMMKDGRYPEAIKIYEAMEDYKDCRTLLVKARFAETFVSGDSYKTFRDMETGGNGQIEVSYDAINKYLIYDLFGNLPSGSAVGGEKTAELRALAKRQAEEFAQNYPQLVKSGITNVVNYYNNTEERKLLVSSLDAD